MRFTPLFLAAGMVVWPRPDLWAGGLPGGHAKEPLALTISASSTSATSSRAVAAIIPAVSSNVASSPCGNVGRIPAFAWLRREFALMESHCGQIESAPRGSLHLVENGPDGHTRIQGLRRADRPIYAAQFHMELDGTPENSRRIMDNFLKVAVARRGTGRWPAAFDDMEPTSVPPVP